MVFWLGRFTQIERRDRSAHVVIIQIPLSGSIARAILSDAYDLNRHLLSSDRRCRLPRGLPPRHQRRRPPSATRSIDLQDFLPKEGKSVPGFPEQARG